jgi:hypothetical protein
MGVATRIRRTKRRSRSSFTKDKSRNFKSGSVLEKNQPKPVFALSRIQDLKLEENDPAFPYFKQLEKITNCMTKPMLEFRVRPKSSNLCGRPDLVLKQWYMEEEGTSPSPSSPRGDLLSIFDAVKQLVDTYHLYITYLYFDDPTHEAGLLTDKGFQWVQEQIECLLDGSDEDDDDSIPFKTWYNTTYTENAMSMKTLLFGVTELTRPEERLMYLERLLHERFQGILVRTWHIKYKTK